MDYFNLFQHVYPVSYKRFELIKLGGGYYFQGSGTKDQMGGHTVQVHPTGRTQQKRATAGRPFSKIENSLVSTKPFTKRVVY